MAARKKVNGKGNFNLAKLDTLTTSTQGIEVEIKHPVTFEPIKVNGKGDVLTFRVIGPDAPAFKKARNEYLRRYLDRKNDGKKASSLVDELDAENVEEDNLTFVAGAVVGWKNMYFDPDGGDDTTVELEFSEDECMRVLRSCPWIVEQLQVVISNRANFIKE